MENNFWLKLDKPILALAPMAGITDSAFRALCQENGADVVYSEMASVSALFFKPAKTLELLKFRESERPYVVQLFGKTPEHFARAAQIVTKEIEPDGIDINFGCPAKKVFGHGSGCALMPQKELAREIIQAVCNNTDLPVSIKIRAGIENPKAKLKDILKLSLRIDALEFIENVKDLPFSAVMVHGRTYEGSFTGQVNFSIIEEIKKIIPGRIVLGNGGILDPQDAKNILEKHPLLDGLGIARGSWGKPYLFGQIKELIENDSFHEPSFQELTQLAIRHAKLLFEDKGEKGIFEIRKHLVWYFKGFPNASELRQSLVLAKSVDEIEEILASF